MKYLTPSFLFALVVLAVCLYFLLHCAAAFQSAPGSLDWVREGHTNLSFAGKCHHLNKKDILPLLLITLLYACSAFYQLGDLAAPTAFTDFAEGSTLTIQIAGAPVYSTGIRYYTGLGTGGYNVEISPDGEHWSTLWQRKNDKGDIQGYYWADAAGYAPSYALAQGYNQLFKWIEITVDNPQNIQYIRITGRAEKPVLELGRLCLLDPLGTPIPFEYALSGGPAEQEEAGTLLLVDDLVPYRSTWHNSTYFDEIYHARTAKEHIDGVYPYEITHPPLGKLIIGLGIRLFGMTPFGWRFSGALFGVLMLPALYIFLKNMFGKTVLSVCGTTLFAAEFMHLTQTRIATIDTYSVFFILCMYLFLYRYLTLPAGTGFFRGAPSLFFSGLMWGLGAASKWTVFYAGVGLAILYFMGLYQKLRDWPIAKRRGGWLAATLVFSVLCFVVMPFAIYVLSYIPYAQAKGVEITLESTLTGLREGLVILFQNVMGKLTGGADFTAKAIPTDTLGGIVANNQWYMFNYHSGVTSSHPYSSWWFQWIVNGRPILYYMDNSEPGFTTRFAAFSNPVVCWTGLGAVLICAAHSFRRPWARRTFLAGLGLFSAAVIFQVQHTPNGIFDVNTLARGEFKRNLILLGLCLALYFIFCAVILRLSPGYSSKAAFILVAYLSQLVPWMFVSRTTFAYHYFPSILFLVMAISYLFNALIEVGQFQADLVLPLMGKALSPRKWGWKVPVFSLTALAVILYALFYPVLIGLQIPVWYEAIVKWLPSWPL